MTHGLPDDLKTKMLEQIPLSRFGAPADIAGPVLFLCSDACA